MYYIFYNENAGPTVWLHMISRGYKTGSWRACPKARWPCALVEACSPSFCGPFSVTVKLQPQHNKISYNLSLVFQSKRVKNNDNLTEGEKVILKQSLFSFFVSFFLFLIKVWFIHMSGVKYVNYYTVDSTPCATDQTWNTTHTLFALLALPCGLFVKADDAHEITQSHTTVEAISCTNI